MIIDLVLGTVALCFITSTAALVWIAISLFRQGKNCCTGEEGPPGPMGAEGPRGLPGAPGQVNPEVIRQIVIDELARQPRA